MSTRFVRRNTPDDFAVFICEGHAAVGAMLPGARVKAIPVHGKTDVAMSNRLMKTLLLESDSARKSRESDIGHPLVPRHRPGEFGLAGILRKKDDAVFASALIEVLSKDLCRSASGSHVVLDPLIGRAPYWKPGGYLNRMQEQEQERESTLRSELVGLLERLSDRGPYRGLEALTTGSAESILTSMLNACVAVVMKRSELASMTLAQLPMNQGMAQAFLRSHLASVEPDPRFCASLVWLCRSVRSFYLEALPWTRYHDRTFSIDPGKAELLLAVSFLSAALPEADRDPWPDGSFSDYGPEKVFPIDTMTECVKSALEALRMWNRLLEKGTPVPWAGKLVRNRTGLNLPQEELSVITAIREETPLREWPLLDRSGRKSHSFAGRGGVGKTYGMLASLQNHPYVWGGGVPHGAVQGVMQQLPAPFAAANMQASSLTSYLTAKYGGLPLPANNPQHKSPP